MAALDKLGSYLIEDSVQSFEMMFETKLACDCHRARAQFSINVRVLQAFDDGVREFRDFGGSPGAR